MRVLGFGSRSSGLGCFKGCRVSDLVICFRISGLMDLKPVMCDRLCGFEASVYRAFVKDQGSGVPVYIAIVAVLLRLNPSCEVPDGLLFFFGGLGFRV